jgi:D-alanyl-D-alanine carboxypeptidase (penicillin-binding protein 5/6)
MKTRADNKRKLWPFVLIGLILVIALYVSWVYFVAKPVVSPSFRVKYISAVVPAKSLAWPSGTQAAIGLGSSGAIGTYGTQKPVAMASEAKLITALCVLNKYPLALNQAGPTITLGPSDVAIYAKYQSEDGSDLVVINGEKLSEYQMLQAMLLPSADNIADSLAIWAFGSLPNYSVYANQYVKSQGLSETTVGLDASGFDSGSMTTAANLVSIGQLFMASPVLANIVGLPSATGFPVVGTIKNVNFDLGKDNIIGIKTGNTEQAGGVFLSASKITVNNSPLVVYTAVMQAPTLFDALANSLPLVLSVQSNFTSVFGVSLLPDGQEVAEYTVPWSNKKVPVVVSQPIELTSWGGSRVISTISLDKISNDDKAGQIVGQIVIKSSLLNGSATDSLVLSRAISPPSKIWLILHPQSFIHL